MCHTLLFSKVVHHSELNWDLIEVEYNKELNFKFQCNEVAFKLIKFIDNCNVVWYAFFEPGIIQT